ncbi:MAG: hypothetical protein MUO58_04900 [Anaerolineales bacterium]|nr:hypothetical protein [Anaerolineales bacterium]
MKLHSIVNIPLVVAFAAIWIVGCSAKVDVEAVEVTEDLTVTFDGSSCKYDGPQVIREGEITMIMNNLSDSPVFVDLARLDDDKTWQDMLDYIGEPGSYKQRPGWITKENRRPVISDPRAAIFSPDPGYYVIVCYQTTATGLATFPGSPLEVR